MNKTKKPRNNNSPSKVAVMQAPSFGLCCCCLELPCPKNLWSEHKWNGDVEVYADMIQECFGFTFPEELKGKQQICEICISRLRHSLWFRRQVERSRAALVRQLATLLPADKIIKTEAADEEQLKLGDITEPIKQEDVAEDKTKLYLEDLQIDSAVDDNCAGAHGSVDDEMEVTKEEDKKPTKKVNKKNSKLPKSRANTDRRTLPRTGHIRPRENIGNLLQNTTILPFKSNKGYFNCFYCNKQFVVVDALRSHVACFHRDLTFAAIIKNILRPHDRIKADVSDITCKICQERCSSLEEAVQHLETHEIKFNYEDKLLKPTDCLLAYDLSDGKFTCVVCRAEFHFFKTLTKHMNEHSTNYVCDVCGKCFLLSERLKAHAQVHAADAAVHCDLCGKQCTTAGRLRSHKRHHHKKRSHVCSICNQPFPTFRQRMQHLEDVHDRSPLNLSCKICMKNFKTTSHLGCHMRTEHYNIPYVRKRKKKIEEKGAY